MNSIWHPNDDNAQEKAYQYIKEAILGFQLKPDQRLVASELATALDSSRTPIREALSRLEQEGLVMRAGGWGYLVRGMKLADVQEMFKVREALEVEAVAEAMPNLSPAWFEQMHRALEQAKNSTKPGEFVALNRSFHNKIAAATNNELLRYMLSFISDRVQMVGAMTVTHRAERSNEILAENHAILRALEAGDVPAAQEAIRAHIRNGREHATRILVGEGSRFVSTSAR